MFFSNIYQYALILFALATTALFAIFFHREVYPEYKVYQKDYVELEEFRSTYTHEPPPAFSYGIKQIVIERADKGPPVIDRCISCHVALEYSHFSPTKIAYDVNGVMERDANGNPRQVPNENYVWARLDAKIAELTQSKEGMALADHYQSLKTAKVGHQTYDMSKVLRMHPLMGRETRPFEYHPIEQYGCVSCHNGNGRGLVTDRAHGPVFDGQYESEYEGPKPKFTEDDPKNDPPFSRMFNEKPGPRLLFQTAPILIGGLIEAKCMDCHLESKQALHRAESATTALIEQKKKKVQAVQKSYHDTESALQTLQELKKSLDAQGYDKTLVELKAQAKNYTLTADKRNEIEAQIIYLAHTSGEGIEKQIQELQKNLKVKKEAYDKEKKLLQDMPQNSLDLKAIESDVDQLTPHFKFGEELYISQACYACHRIAGFARGGVGPELTREGLAYPWFLKESMVWPQADVRNSTMPNFRLDHEELEALMTFLLAQKGQPKSISNTDYQTAIQQWESGQKTAYEKPITPVQMNDVRFGMKLFATEGCAACHRLKGFESNVGYTIEKGEKPSFDALYEERAWFKRLIPEMIVGSELVNAVEKHAEEIDKHIAADVRQGAILEEIEMEFPGQIEAIYMPFKYATRAKNDAYSKDPEKLKKWKERLHRVLMMYVQEYGLGRLIGPRPNWAGIYRSDEWLMEHFYNPSAHVARSIMPVFPFDESKFYALTHMLDKLAVKNRDSVRAIWEKRGFNPGEAFQIHCSQCHGEFLQGNGPVAEWIYPIPKNLRNADFLRNMTKERVAFSITHGVKGTPMPPWGEIGFGKETEQPVLNKTEIHQLVDWLFASLPGAEVIKHSQDVPKWRYTPEDILKELYEEGNELKSGTPADLQPSGSLDLKGPLYASLKPEISTTESVEEVFDILPSPNPPDVHLYYIKKKYYTEENLEEGKLFFETNCATCHGAEADGSGMRAAAMRDAKPRMLTNLDWINTRDDLRLLRSIKYGVPGTAMNPWGDLTSSLQRLQLVIFIRSLSYDRYLRDRLSEALFKTYSDSTTIVDKARVAHYPELDKINKNYVQLQARRRQLYEAQETEAVDIYKQEIEALTKLREQEAIDQILQKLDYEIDNEKVFYQVLGQQIIAQEKNEESLGTLLEIIKANANRYIFKEGKLTALFDEETEKKIAQLGQKLADTFKQKMDALHQKEILIQGKMASPERTAELTAVTHEIKAYDTLLEIILTNLEEAVRSRKKQQELLQEFQKKVSL